jgi:pyridoxal phosphate enzyme (YggS family)
MTAIHGTALAFRVEQVRDRIAAACARAGRDPAEVTLVAVSKTFPASAVLEAMDAGVTDFGENYVQEALQKQAVVREASGLDAAPRFHFIGHLQSNKARGAAGAFAILHGVDSKRLLDVLATSPTGPVHVMLQVNLAGETTKHGLPPEEVGRVLGHARSLGDHVLVRGLMTIPPPGPAEASRPFFRRLRDLAAEHGLRELSMGMTGDFEVAIEEGATHVRVGRAIFGERP